MGFFAKLFGINKKKDEDQVTESQLEENKVALTEDDESIVDELDAKGNVSADQDGESVFADDDVSNSIAEQVEEAEKKEPSCDSSKNNKTDESSAQSQAAAEAAPVASPLTQEDEEADAAETAEQERLEAERIAAEKAEQERLEAERIAAEKAEQERLEAERIAAEKAEQERLEAERIAAEKAEQERLEAERIAAEKAEQERLEAERIAAEKAEQERLEAERIAAEKAEQERLEAERIAAEKAEQERLEADRIAAEKAEQERLEAERIAAEKAEQERLEAERIAAEKELEEQALAAAAEEEIDLDDLESQAMAAAAEEELDSENLEDAEDSEGAAAAAAGALVAAAAVEEAKQEERQSFFSRLKKTRDNLAFGVSSLIFGRKIDEDLYEDLETALLTADLGVDTTQKVIERLRDESRVRDLRDAGALRNNLKKILSEILEPCEKPLVVYDHTPFVILMVGVNGAGKTTTIGKLARKYQDQGLKVMLAAGDTFRAAAVEQLKEWGERANVPVIAQSTGSDSASVIYDALSAAKARGMDVLICDTAGRLQNKDHLMDELRKIVRVMQKLDPKVPHETMLVLDAATGQNAVSQTRVFTEAVNVTGLTLTKLDGTAKGGVVFSLANLFNIPIRYVGIGEKAEDLREFKIEPFVDALVEDEESK